MADQHPWRVVDIPQLTLLPRPCAVETCGADAKTRGWCKPHYLKWWAHGDPLWTKPPGPTGCKESGCPRKHSARGWCRYHYNLLRPRAVCSIKGCGNLVVARGWCGSHHRLWLHNGDPLINRRTSPAERRFWAKVDKNGPLPDYAPHLGPCWLWTGTHAGTGYGHISINRKSRPAHRFAFELLVGPIPDGLQLDHLCRVRHCVKTIEDEHGPAHLEPVTQRENILRGTGVSARHARKTHCPKGHEYTPENTYRHGVGRKCRQCAHDTARAINRRYREALAR